MKQDLFTLKAWYLWAVHSILVSGLILIGGIVWLQVSHADFVIQVPTIEHTFKK